MAIVNKGITPRKMGDEQHTMVTDPHARQSISNAKIHVANICDGLNNADPAGKDVYDANAKSYLVELEALEKEVK